MKAVRSSISTTVSFTALPKAAAPPRKGNPPVPIPPRLLAHLRRWRDKQIVRNFIVEWNGEPIRSSVKTAFNSAAAHAGLEGRVTAHTLRHTAATWLMQAGVDKWEAAGFLGMSVEMLDRVYGHHHPNHLKQGARSIGYRRSNLSLAIPLATSASDSRDTTRAIEIFGGPGRTRTCNQTVMSEQSNQ